MQRFVSGSAEDAFEVTVPAGQGERCVHRLIDVLVTRTSLLLDHSMIFHADDRVGYTYSATKGVLLNPEAVPASFFQRHTDGCSSTANRSSPDYAYEVQHTSSPLDCRVARQEVVEIRRRN